MFTMRSNFFREDSVDVVDNIHRRVRRQNSDSKPESRERVISSPKRISTRNDVNLRKDILESISSRVETESKELTTRRRDISSSGDRNSNSKNSSLAQKESKPTDTSRRTAKTTDFKCGGSFTVYISEEITSPLYPSKYPPNVDCRWNISAQKGQTIKIEIFRLNIETNDANCKFDYLDIKGVRRLCGKVTESVIPVNTSSVELRFRSDANNEDFGFHLRIVTESVDCVRELNVTNFVFVTSPKYPNNYEDSTDCWTLIRAERDTTLTITFETLLLEHDSHCAYDYLEVFDSSTANKSLGKFCEKPEGVTFSMISSGNVILLHFHSDQLLNNKGFRAEVSTSKSANSNFGCNWKVNWSNMTLDSPNFPDNYLPNLNCEMSISSPSDDERVVIVFDWIHLEAGSKCENNDRLEIWEDERAATRVICGRYSQPFKYVAKNRTIKLKFISDNFAEFPGFTSRLTYLNERNPESRTITSKFISDNFAEFPGFTSRLTYLNERNPESRTITSKVFRTPENATVIIGSTHVLHCEPLTNDPITWFKNDKQITTGIAPNGKTLIIKEFTTASEGRYICKFGKEYREGWLSARKTTCPSVIFRKRPKDQSVSEGDFVVLECNVVDSRNAVKWEKDGRSLANISRVNQLHNGYLLLDPAMSEDSGIYYCIANPDSADCAVKSGARVSVNRRVNVNNICGISHSNQPNPDVSKIIGGTEATKAAFPWHVMFWDYRRKAFCGGPWHVMFWDYRRKAFCGGVNSELQALLNERWVVTAAHCFETGSESAIEVKLGKFDQTVIEETEFVAKIAEVIRHPDFSRDTFDNDIALVRLSQHISFTPSIVPICLVDKRERRATDEFFLKPNSALRIGHVTGWGQLKENGPQPRFLQELRVPIVEEGKCRSSTAFKVTANMFCAGYGKEVLGDACKGDSGGPFVVPYKSRWIMLGVVSWGEGCGRSGKFGFYTKVNNYLDWINAIIKL
ncbi:unnamed protein product [Oppiella nova]|uniref:limulus clotting factor C n=1 Tax=Oppiella nova TaxID=334625 RepID=A0A7R9LL48_9ACAR|nr:unnamed protein product [Oppiella nova]CAG2164721.1 unnamed protein product [Oppiella nova]